jgi:dihydroneopterin aldolase
MVSIELHNIRLHAYHGLYAGEEKTGSPYEVSLTVTYDEGDVKFDDLRHTINYVDVFEIVKQRMKIATPLLEKVAEGIIHQLKHQYPFAIEATVSIYKLEPPIENIQGKLGVTMHKRFDV